MAEKLGLLSPPSRSHFHILWACWNTQSQTMNSHSRTQSMHHRWIRNLLTGPVIKFRSNFWNYNIIHPSIHFKAASIRKHISRKLICGVQSKCKQRAARSGRPTEGEGVYANLVFIIKLFWSSGSEMEAAGSFSLRERRFKPTDQDARENTANSAQ